MLPLSHVIVRFVCFFLFPFFSQLLGNMKNWTETIELQLRSIKAELDHSQVMGYSKLHQKSHRGVQYMLEIVIVIHRFSLFFA